MASTKNFTASISERLGAALKLPNGARFYRCALQVNPFAYLIRHNKPTPFSDEAGYNAAIIAACHELDIRVIAVTDHFRVADSWGLVHAARDAGIFTFGGFEAVSKDGIHCLCLFDPEKDNALERYIGECGVWDQGQISPIANLDAEELLRHAKEWGAACIPVHVTADGGLLTKISGQSRVKVWTSDALLACAIPGAAAETADNFRRILDNKEDEYRRPRPIAILNASDVNGPEYLRKQDASSFIKMSQISVEALRQAFLDPDSRIRLHSDPTPEPHTEFLAMTWEGGFLDQTAVHFNENLNVLIGGRGTGKSTLIESVRYVLGLDPLGAEARLAHDGFVQHVLGHGTKISLLVRSHRPSARVYRIERSIPNPPVVKSESGEVLALSPRDAMPGIEVFGQHEISELAKSPEKLTLLLARFLDRDPTLEGRKSRLMLELERSRGRIIVAIREMKALEERLAALPRLEETLKRFQEAGLEERLKEKSLVIREEAIFTAFGQRLDPIRSLHADLAETLPLDGAFVSGRALEGLPNAAILAELEIIWGTLGAKLKDIADQLAKVIADANAGWRGTKARWDEKQKVIEQTYEKLLRELQKSKIDGAEFIRLRKQIEELRPLRERREALGRELAEHETQRRTLLAEWDDLKGKEHRNLAQAANKVSKKLTNRVRVEVEMAGDRESLIALLRELGGNLSAAYERLKSYPQLSLPELAQHCREGRDALIRRYELAPGSAERIANAGEDRIMRIEELSLPATTIIELNTAPDGAPPNWQTLKELSTGQKATAVLLLLLLESEAPLVVDQPEDDLDNRFITESVVPIMRSEKQQRQFLFSTHNANIPVLGDAELILGLSYSGNEGHAKIAQSHMGSIDTKPVRELVEEILEGGKTAFELRRSKYGF